MVESHPALFLYWISAEDVVHIHVFLSAAAMALMSVTPFAQLRAVPEDFTAVAVPGSDVVSDAGTVLMSLDRWSTAAEHLTLARTLEKGPSAVLDELRNMRPVGTIRTPGSPGYDLRYARQTTADNGGRRIVLATDRPIEFWEACQRPRLGDDSPFTVIQMHIDAEGRGTGTLSIATKIRAYDDISSIALEDLASCRVMLTDILAVPDDERE
jgi:hypothetical protein